MASHNRNDKLSAAARAERQRALPVEANARVVRFGGARDVPHISHLGNFVLDDPETDLAQDERLRHIPADMTRRLPGLTGAKNTDGIGHTNNREWRGPRCDGRKVVA